MDKKYLGLGFTFSAQDDGLKNMFRTVSNDLYKVNQNMKDVDKSGKGMMSGDGVFAKLADFAKLGALGSIGGKLKDLKKGLLGEEKHELAFEKLDEMIAQMAYLGKEGAKDGLKLRDALLKVAQTTGTMPDEMATVVTELLKGGVKVGDMSDKVLGRMGEMMSFFKVSAEDTTDFFRRGLSPALGMNSTMLDDLVQQSVRFSKGFGMPPDLKALPNILKTVEEKTAFKGLKGAALADTVKGIQKMSVMFQSLGKGPEAATQAATDMFAKMKEIEKGFSKMTSGLDADVNAFWKSALITGAQNATKAMKANDPTQMFMSLKESIENAKKAGGNALPVMRNWIEDSFGPDVLRGVDADWKNISKGIENANAKVDEDPYKQYIARMKETIGYTKQLTAANKDVMDIMKGFAVRKEVITGLKLQTEAYRELAGEIQSGQSNLSKFVIASEVFERMGISGMFLKFAMDGKKSFKDLSASQKNMAKGMIQTGAVFEMIGESFDQILTKVATFGFAWYALQKPIGWMFKGLKFLAQRFRVLSYTTAEGVEKVGLISKAFTKMMSIMKGIASYIPKIVGTVKIGISKVGSLLKSVGGFLEGLLLKFGSKGGIFTKIFSWGPLRAAAGLLSKIVAPLFAIGDAAYILYKNWDSFMSRLTAAPSTMGKVKEVAMTIRDTFTEVFDDLMFGIPSLISNALVGMDFSKAFAHLTSYMGDAVSSGLVSAFYGISDAWDNTFDRMKSGWNGFVVWLLEGINKVADNLGYMGKLFKIDEKTIKQYKDKEQQASKSIETRDLMSKERSGLIEDQRIQNYQDVEKRFTKEAGNVVPIKKAEPPKSMVPVQQKIGQPTVAKVLPFKKGTKKTEGQKNFNIASKTVEPSIAELKKQQKEFVSGYDSTVSMKNSLLERYKNDKKDLQDFAQEAGTGPERLKLSEQELYKRYKTGFDLNTQTQEKYEKAIDKVSTAIAKKQGTKKDDPLADLQKAAFERSEKFEKQRGQVQPFYKREALGVPQGKSFEKATALTEGADWEQPLSALKAEISRLSNVIEGMNKKEVKVNVTLQGDAKKFIKAATKVQNDDAATRGTFGQTGM